MSCGRSWTINKTNSGWLMQTPWDCRSLPLAQGMRQPLISCGSRCLPSIDNACMHRIFGRKHAAGLCPQATSRPWGKKRKKTKLCKEAITTRCVNGCLLLHYEKETLSFSKLVKFIGAICGTSSTPTTNHYFCRTYWITNWQKVQVLSR